METMADIIKKKTDAAWENLTAKMREGSYPSEEINQTKYLLFSSGFTTGWNAYHKEVEMVLSLQEANNQN